MSEPIKITISKPIATHQGTVTELTLNDPTAASYMKHGEPFQVRFEGERANFIYDNKNMMGFLQDMTGVDTILLSALDARDYLILRTAATNKLLGIAGEDFTNPSGEQSAS